MARAEGRRERQASQPAVDTPSTRAMVAMGKKAWFALMNWKTRMGSPRSPVRTRLLPLPGYRAPGAVAGSHAADGSAPRARRWSGRPVGGLHRDQPDEPSSRSPGRSVRTCATAPPVFAQIGPEQPSVAGIPAHRVGDSSASMAPPSQLERCPPNRVNSNSRPTTSVLAHHPKPIARSITTQRCGCAGGYGPNTRSGDAEAGRIHSRTSTGTSGSYVCPTGGAARRGRRREVLSESAVREIYLLRSMSGVWKRSHGRPTKAPPDERGGNRHGRANTTAPHPDSTNSGCAGQAAAPQVNPNKRTPELEQTYLAIRHPPAGRQRVRLLSDRFKIICGE